MAQLSLGDFAMLKIKGLSDLSRSLEEAQEALSNLDGDLPSISFNPTEPASIEAAIQEMESVIDERVGSHGDNPFVRPLVESAKERFRQVILDKAAASRAADSES